MWQYWMDFRADEGLEVAGVMPRFWQSMGYDIGERLEAWKRPPHPDLASQRLIYAPNWLCCCTCKAWRAAPLPEGMELDQMEPVLWTCDQHIDPMRRACLHRPEAEICTLHRQSRTLDRSAMQRYVGLLAQHELAMYQRGELSRPGELSLSLLHKPTSTLRPLAPFAAAGAQAHLRHGRPGRTHATAVADPRLAAYKRGAAATAEDVSLTGGPLTIYPGLARDEALRRNVKRCIGHLLPETHPFWRDNDLQTASPEVLKAITADVIVKEHKDTTCQAVVALEEEVAVRKGPARWRGNVEQRASCSDGRHAVRRA